MSTLGHLQRSMHNKRMLCTKQRTYRQTDRDADRNALHHDRSHEVITSNEPEINEWQWLESIPKDVVNVRVWNRKAMLDESIMYYEEFAASAKEQNESEMFVRGCNAAGYVHNLMVQLYFCTPKLQCPYSIPQLPSFVLIAFAFSQLSKAVTVLTL